MNVARKLETKGTTDNKEGAVKRAEVIYLPGRKAGEDKKLTLDYLNEKLAYFYANGGPVMDI
ncbi:MAG: hypothetical protein VB084_05540 [Syntrophomonadaceae bacterium]|nr:hypothetical protein [Syntrophomonadaceae bacterium]